MVCFLKLRHVFLGVCIALNYTLFTSDVKAHIKLEQDSGKKTRFLVAPFLIKSPETRWGFGVTGSISFKTTFRSDTLTRLSQIQVFGFYTQNKQNVQVIDALVFFPKENYIFRFLSSHSFFPDKFWGIGPNTKNNSWERYTYEQIYIAPQLKKRIIKRFYVGALYELQSVLRVNYLTSGVFDNSNFFGKTPYLVSGPGFSLGYDSRNKAFWPDKGLYVQSQLVSYNKGFVSDKTLLKYTVDVRYFKKIYRSQILALQFYSYQTYGDTPLRDLASLGGGNNLRGFYQGRFRDKNMATLIGEYRIPLWRRWSACVFGGLGSVYKTVNELGTGSLKYSCGGGLRFNLLEKDRLNLRLDYGYSSKFNSGFYFTVGECF